jgi:hypothetical protein
MGWRGVFHASSAEWKDPMNRWRDLLVLVALIALVALPQAVRASPPAQNGEDWIQVEDCETVGAYTYCLYYWYRTDCDGWETTFNWDEMWTNDPRYTYMVRQWGSAQSGSWSQPGVLETYPFYYVFTWFGGTPGDAELLHLQTIDFVIAEPAACEPNAGPSCTLTRRYYMYTLQDANQPPSWQPYCYVVSSVGSPSVESQARVCTVPGFEHTYQATSILYAGWVYTDCNGRPYYGWPAWDPAWYRAKFARP